MSATESVHALEVPNDTLPLLLPSACMAEVVGVTRMAKVPHSPPWMLGAIGWRLRPVPVFSYDVLAGGELFSPGPRARIVVLYPLPGREPWEFVGLLATSEPQSRTIDGSMPSVTVRDSYPGIAAALRIDQRVVGIPDFEALVRTLYPAR
ncbi:MAG: chemotaxis protein CheW [Gammaproteobacteria bacterium]|nr:chemotaxis protein CheW [Gammaproteobacteria bacterium]